MKGAGAEVNCLCFAPGGGLYDHQGGIFLNSCFNVFINIGCIKDHPFVLVHLIKCHQHQ